MLLGILITISKAKLNTIAAVICHETNILSFAGYKHRSHCYFPRAWHGEYFHLGYNSPLVVVNNSISGKGKCVENFGSHYVMEDMEYGEKCWKCMTIYRKHQNVLSYKESKWSNLNSIGHSLKHNSASMF